MECSVKTIVKEKLDPVKDIDEMTEGDTEREVEVTIKGVVVDQMTKLNKDGMFIDISRVYNPETKQTLSYPSEIVLIEPNEILRSIKKDWL
jgi:hypothetical protein